MAIIKCPKCKRTISDQAGICVHCGYPIDDGKERAEREYHRDILRTVILIIASGIYIVLYTAIFLYIGWLYSMWGTALFLILYFASFYFVFHKLRQRAWIATKVFSPAFVVIGSVMLLGISEKILYSHFFQVAVPAIMAICTYLSIFIFVNNIRRMYNGEYELTAKALLKEERRLLKQFAEDTKSQN